MCTYEFKWVNDIQEIGKKAWNKLYKGESFLKQYDFMNVVQSSKLEDVVFYYLCIKNTDELVGIIPCFKYNLKMEVLSTKYIKKIVELLRKINNNILNTSLFGIGCPIATCENHINIDNRIFRTVEGNKVKSLILRKIVDKHKELKTSIMVIKEIPHNELKYVKELFGGKIKIYESLPNSYIPIFKDTLSYPQILKKRYRQRFRRSSSEVKNINHKWEVIKDFHHMADQIYLLYESVYKHSKVQFEKLNTDFFFNISQLKNSYLLTCKDSGELICVELIIEDKKSLIPMYLGLDYQKTNNTNVYNNVIYNTIKLAEQLDKDWVALGQTSYRTKAYSGALFEKTFLGIYSCNTILRMLIKTLNKQLFPAFQKPNINAVSSIQSQNPEYINRINSSGKKFE